MHIRTTLHLSAHYTFSASEYHTIPGVHALKREDYPQFTAKEQSTPETLVWARTITPGRESCFSNTDSSLPRGSGSPNHCYACAITSVQTYGIPLTKYLIILKSCIWRGLEMVFSQFLKILLSSIYSNPAGITQYLSLELLPASPLSTSCTSVLVPFTHHVHPGQQSGCLSPQTSSPWRYSSSWKRAPLWSWEPSAQVTMAEQNGGGSRERRTNSRKKTHCANFIQQVKEKWFILKQ